MKAVLLPVAVVAVALICCSAAPFDGYIVTGQWDGRTIPSPQWGLDITRQTTLWRPKQELVLQNLIPMREGDILSPGFTAFDPISRSYFLAMQRNTSSASLWGIVISPDTNTSKLLSSEVLFNFPEDELPFVGVEVFNNNGQLVVLAIFRNCIVLQVDYKTGATSNWATLCNETRVATSAIEVNGNEMFVITQNEEGPPQREVVIVNLPSKQWESNLIQPLKNHNETHEQPFEMVWCPTIKNLIVFYTGQFDQLIWTEPHSGMTSMAIFSLDEYNGPTGVLEFQVDDPLASDDTWGESVLDPTTGRLWFQCSDTDPDSGLFTPTLCQIQIPDTIKALNYVNIAIWPMTYGYFGFEWVPVA